MALHFSPKIGLEAAKPIRIAIYVSLETLALIQGDNDLPKAPPANMLYDENPAPIELVREVYTHFFGPISIEAVRPLLRSAHYCGQPQHDDPASPADSDTEAIIWQGYKIIFDYKVPPEDDKPRCNPASGPSRWGQGVGPAILWFVP